MNKSLLAVAVASLLSPISNLHAQQASADETMVVTANRFEQSTESVVAQVEKGEMTYKQAQGVDAQVRKGETGTMVVYASRFTKTETDARGDEVELELVVQVTSDDVVHGELDAEAEAVRRNHAPHSVVLHANHVDLKRRFLFESTRSVHEFVVTVR